jgi:hypothetical protein
MGRAQPCRQSLRSHDEAGDRHPDQPEATHRGRSAPADGVAAVSPTGRVRRRDDGPRQRPITSAVSSSSRFAITGTDLASQETNKAQTWPALGGLWQASGVCQMGWSLDRPKHAPRRTLPSQLRRYIAVDLPTRTILDKMRHVSASPRAFPASLRCWAAPRRGSAAGPRRARRPR